MTCTCGPIDYDGYDACRQTGCDPDCPECSFTRAELEADLIAALRDGDMDEARAIDAQLTTTTAERAQARADDARIAGGEVHS